MSDNQNLGQPFRHLGGQLKSLREANKETLAEVSGAVEIELDALQRIETGEQRPSEEILLLLISHFEIKDEEAVNLWELAGYDDDKTSTTGSVEDITNQMKQTAFVMPMDVRVVYTDMVHVMVNNYGVVMNFMQNSGPNNQPLAIARVGMSKEHARSVLEVLQQTLDQAERPVQPKKLSAPRNKQTKADTN